MLNPNCVFVGNIPYNFEEEGLLKVIQMVGPLKEFRVKIDQITGQPEGFGFAEYNDKNIAASALKNLKNIDYKDRQLRIDTAKNDADMYNFNYETIKLKNDMTFLKKEKEPTTYKDSFSLLTHDQRIILFDYLICMQNIRKEEFLKLLENQSEQFLKAFIEFQENHLKELGKNNAGRTWRSSYA